MNTPSQDGIDTVVRNARRRHRLRQILLGLFAVMALLNAAFTVRMLFAGVGQGQAISVLPAFALTVISMALLWRIWRAGQREAERMQAMTQPGIAAIEHALTATRAHINELKRFRLVVIAVMLPLFAVAVGGLYAQGKMQGMHVVWFGVLLGIVTVALLGVIRHRLKLQLEPQLQRLGEILAQFEMRA